MVNHTGDFFTYDGPHNSSDVTENPVLRDLLKDS